MVDTVFLKTETGSQGPLSDREARCGGRASNLLDGQHVHADRLMIDQKDYIFLSLPQCTDHLCKYGMSSPYPNQEPATLTSTARLETPETFWHST